ncbi:hypothetical protein AWZ03_006137 [Drosophila navojoa]|uniref:CLIP domain-containing serine protease n=1 Tax=Drosophila navojoa TaxID=7232 RepID=A0A484BFA0_DRONA|nr:serine protease easter [Drosophila navojoa]TDG47409.1 hypothetical protein AWZ03_006137 [Drosophila navojoa]
MGVYSGRLAAIVAVWAVTLSAAAAQRKGDCLSLTRNGRVTGQCIPVRECEYFMGILSAPPVSQSDRNLLRDNQCNRQQNGNINVCCPIHGVAGVGQTSRDSLGALTHPLLPRECGGVKWQRSNDTETKINEYPWLALIEYTKPSQEKLHACGGVLISERYVLTAAHCASGKAISNGGWQMRAVRLGEWDTLTNPDCQVSGVPIKTECAPPYQDVLIEEVIVHPDYNKDSPSQTYDIAMIRLKDAVKLNNYVQPICLPNQQLHADELEDLVTEVGGWKATSSSRLRKNEVIIESIETCQKQYAAQNIHIMASQLCGSARTNECHGNAGGPLMLLKNNVYLLGGLLSFGPVPCPSTGWPDIYTRVASYIEWIHRNLKA